ncbi:MAG: glycosyltransferase [Thermoleophilia bacterium]|nr:glycosyltransferase [Thermoleophilia bacterium]MDH5333509.1 glycosyltransferase [Thermoleophilia bacterium]
MRLTVIVPATDEPATLPRCLAAIDVAQAPPEEVIVVREPVGAGPAEARNAGASTATGDVLAFVDSDVLVHADAFDRIRRALADERLVAVFGSYDDHVATRGAVSAFRNLLHHTVHQRSAGPAASFWAGLGAVRASAFATVGGFDARRYPAPSIEDIELGGRLTAHGGIVLDPDLQGTHLKEWTLGSMVRTDFSRRGVPWVQLMRERREIPATLNLGARERASAVAAVVAAGGVAARRPGLVVASLAVGMALNADLHATLWRRLGPRGVALGVPLHALHQLVAAAAVPVGLTATGIRATPRAPARSARRAP